MSQLDAMLDSAVADANAARRQRRDLFVAPSVVAPIDEPTQPTQPTQPAQEAQAAPFNLPPEFWEARPALAHVRAAAWSRNRSPDAVLGSVLARVALLVPPSVRLPAIVGATATVDVIVALVAPSGVGKSTAMTIGAELVPIHDEAVLVGVPIGSGEGLIDAFLAMVDEVGTDGKTRSVKRQVRRAVLAVVDEGQVLAELSKRQGSTIEMTLRTGWSGNTLGQANASEATRRHLPAGDYRLAVLVALQPEHAVTVVRDSPGGTPQRFLWLSATDPSIPDDAPKWPGELPLTLPQMGDPFAGFTVAHSIAAEVVAEDRARNRGGAVADPLDGHATLLRLKVAALLATLDGRTDIDVDDWRLAGQVGAVSRAVRQSIVEYDWQQSRQRDDAAIAKAARREVVVADTTARNALIRAARSVAARAHKAPDLVLKRGDVTRAVASRYRSAVTIDEVIDEAVVRKWLTPDGDGWRAGEAKPDG